MQRLTSRTPWTGRRWRATSAVAAVVAGLTVPYLPAVGHEATAEATCLQHAFPSQIDVGWGKEDVRYSTTCDLDGIYAGKVLDSLTDGSCVTVQYADPAFSFYNMATSCSSWTNYTFTDQTGDTESQLRLLRDQDSSSWYWNDQY